MVGELPAYTFVPPQMTNKEGIIIKNLAKNASRCLILTMLIGIFSFPSVAQAAAADILPTDITVNYDSEDITVSSDYQAKAIYYTDKYDAKYPTKTEWDSVATKTSGSKKTATFDISWMKKTEDIIYIKSDADNAVVYPVQVNGQDTTFYAYFSGSDSVRIPKKSTTETKLTNANSISDLNSGYVYFTTGRGDTVAQFSDISKIEWKKGTTGKWNDTNTLTLSSFINKGAVLYFRIKGTDSTALTLKDGVYVTDGNRASREVKVTIARVANAPSVKVDGTKYTIGLKAGMEYRIGNGAWINVSDVHGDAKGKVGSITLFDLHKEYTSPESNVNAGFSTDKGLTVSVRTAASDKRIASKVVNVEVLPTEDTKTVTGLGDADDSNDLLKVAYQKGFDVTSGLTITNTSKYAYQVAVVNKTDANIMTNDALDQAKIAKNTKISWVTVKAATFDDAGTKVKRAGVGKISDSKYDEIELGNRIILYRLAAIKEDTKTSDVEFRVASKTEQLSLPAAAAQAIAITGVDGAPASTTDNVVTVNVTGKDVATTFDLIATLSNPSTEAGATPKIISVTSADASASSVTAPTGVKIAANGKLTSTGGKIKISLSKSLAADSTSYWKVTAEGATIYIKLIVTAPAANAGKLAVTLDKGTATGKTKVTATAGSGNTLKYAVGDEEVTGVKVGDAVTGTELTTGTEVDVTVNKYLTVYEVDGNGKAVNFNSTKVIASMIGD